MPDEAVQEHWYVLRSKPNKETALARYGRQHGFNIFYPTIPYQPVNPRAKRVRAYFPGYMFLRADLRNLGLSPVTWMPFSSGVVQVGGEAAAVPDLVVRAISTRIAEIWEAGGMKFEGLKPGDRVIIREGMFEGYEAIFDARLPGTERVRVLLRMLNNRFVPLEVEARLVDKA
jgi:transcription antitermination factor NusG